MAVAYKPKDGLTRGERMKNGLPFEATGGLGLDL